MVRSPPKPNFSNVFVETFVTALETFVPKKHIWKRKLSYFIICFLFFRNTSQFFLAEKKLVWRKIPCSIAKKIQIGTSFQVKALRFFLTAPLLPHRRSKSDVQITQIMIPNLCFLHREPVRPKLRKRELMIFSPCSKLTFFIMSSKKILKKTSRLVEATSLTISPLLFLASENWSRETVRKSTRHKFSQLLHPQSCWGSSWTSSLRISIDWSLTCGFSKTFIPHFSSNRSFGRPSLLKVETKNVFSDIQTHFPPKPKITG